MIPRRRTTRRVIPHRPTVTKLKVSEKLPRGEYLVVRMGGQFLASDLVVTQYRFIHPPWSWWSNEKRPEPKRVKVGHTLETRFVSTAEEAKKFRRLKQAREACEKLNRQYSGLSKATVERHGGK